MHAPDPFYLSKPFYWPLWLRHPVLYWRGWRDYPEYDSGKRPGQGWCRGFLALFWTRTLRLGPPGNYRVWTITEKIEITC